MLRFRRGFIRSVLLIAVFVGLALAAQNAAAIRQEPPSKQSDRPDPFKPLRMFLGKWEGRLKGPARHWKDGARIFLCTERSVYPNLE